MNNEFKKIVKSDVTRYVLESASGGGTSAGNVASVSKAMGGVQRRSNLLVQDVGPKLTPRSPVAHAAQKVAKGSGRHTDRKQQSKQVRGEKHKTKDFAENQDHEISMAGSELHSIFQNAKQLHTMIKTKSEEEGLDAWQQSKITKAADYLNSVLQSLQHEMMGEANSQNIQNQNPNFAKYVELMAKYDMLTKEMEPDSAGLNVQKNASPQFIQQVNALKAQATQLAGTNAQAWEKARKTGGSLTQTNTQLATQLENVRINAKSSAKHFKQGMAEGDRTMSRAAKGNEKYGKDGMRALAKAGRDGASEKQLDAIRDKHDHYNEDWSQKYKNSINCSHPKGFSQRAHCAGKRKHNESIEMEMTCPDCGMCKTHGNNMMEVKQRLDAKCWKGKHKEGTKIKGGVRVNNCVPNESIQESQLDELDRPSGKLFIIVKADNAGATHVFGDFGSVPRDVVSKISKRGTRDKAGVKTKLKIDFLFDDFRSAIQQLRTIFRDVDFVGAETAEFIIDSSALRSDQGEDVKQLRDYIEAGDDRRMKMYQKPEEDDDEEGEVTGGNLPRAKKPQTQMGGKSVEQPGMITYRFKDARIAQQLRGMNLGFNIKGDSITVDQKQKAKLVSMLGDRFSDVFTNKEQFKEQDIYLESLSTALEQRLSVNDTPEEWRDDFEHADPVKYKQFRNKTVEKKHHMADVARYRQIQKK